MKVKEAITIYMALNQLLGTKLKGSTSFKISRLSIKFQVENDAFQKTRTKVVDNSGIQDYVNHQGFLALPSDLDPIKATKARKKFDKMVDEIEAIGEQQAEIKIKKSNKFSIGDLVTSDENDIDIEPGVLKSLDLLMTD